jgi:hypothetical protein
VSLRGQGLVDGRLETADVLHRHVFRVGRARLHVLVESGEDLRVEHLEPPDPVGHALELLEFNSN